MEKENERYVVFVDEYGFAIYKPESDSIIYTSIFSEATDAVKHDWDTVILKHGLYNFVLLKQYSQFL